jgi:hypothetical protein
MVARSYAVVTLFVQMIVALAYTATEVGLPFGDGIGVTYWALVFTIGTTAVAILFFALSTLYLSRVVRTTSIVLWIVALLWQIFSVIWMIIIYIGCDADTQCAGNRACDGTTLGPYSGASSRFLALFIEGLVLLIVDAVSMFMAFALRLSRSSWWPIASVGIWSLLLLTIQVCLATAFSVSQVAIPLDAMSMATVILSCIFSAIAIAMFVGTLLFANPILDIATIVAWSAAAVWQLVAAIWFIVVLAGCEGRVACDDHLSCTGVASGSYRHRTRFVAIFVETLLLLVLDAVTIWVVWMIRGARMRGRAAAAVPLTKSK